MCFLAACEGEPALSEGAALGGFDDDERDKVETEELLDTIEARVPLTAQTFGAKVVHNLRPPSRETKASPGLHHRTRND